MIWRNSRAGTGSLSRSSVIVGLMAAATIIALVVYPAVAISWATRGLNLWLTCVVPSLFPFMVVSALYNSSGLVPLTGKLFEPLMRPVFNVPGCGAVAFALGITSGYPIGAKVVADLRRQDLLSKTEAERLLCFANNSGPLFIAGTVATGMYGRPELGPVLMLCHYLGSVCVGIIFSFYKKNDSGRRRSHGASSRDTKTLDSQNKKDSGIGRMLGRAVTDSVNTILMLGGFIIFFSVLTGILTHSGFISSLSQLLNPLLNICGMDAHFSAPLLCGILETTTGNSMVSKVSADLTQQAAATAFILGWAGFSVHSQVASIISESDVDIRPYLCAKLLHGILSAAFTFIAVHQLL